MLAKFKCMRDDFSKIESWITSQFYLEDQELNEIELTVIDSIDSYTKVYYKLKNLKDYFEDRDSDEYVFVCRALHESKIDDHA